MGNIRTWSGTGAQPKSLSHQTGLVSQTESRQDSCSKLSLLSAAMNEKGSMYE